MSTLPRHTLSAYASAQSAYGIYETSFSFSPSSVGESLELSNYADLSCVNDFTHFHLHFLNFSRSMFLHLWSVIDRGSNTCYAAAIAHPSVPHEEISALKTIAQALDHAPLATIYPFIFYAHIYDQH